MSVLQIEAIQQDLQPLADEVNRLCSLHDGRLVMAALLNCAVNIGQVLSKHGKTDFVVDAFIGAAHDASLIPEGETRMIYVDDSGVLGSKQ
jgi:hypothetical protein